MDNPYLPEEYRQRLLELYPEGRSTIAQAVRRAVRRTATPATLREKVVAAWKTLLQQGATSRYTSR